MLSMTTRSNLHTHCTFCDGKDTMETMVQAAIKAGFESIGFSSHCPTGLEFDDVQMDIADTDAYFNELERLRQKYRGTIAVYKGMELENFVQGSVQGGDPGAAQGCVQDGARDFVHDGADGFVHDGVRGFVRPAIDPRCDYTIGSLHYLEAEGGIYHMDYTPDMTDKCLKELGSPEKMLECYFSDYCSFAREVPFDIVGHIDIYTKFNEIRPMIDESSKAYQDLVLPYIEELVKLGRIFEVNTGAMSRGYRSTPYPAAFILRRLHELDAPIILSSDSHSATTIDFGFGQCEAMLRDIGFTHQMKITDSGFVPVEL